MAFFKDVRLQTTLKPRILEDKSIKLLFENTWILLALNQRIGTLKHKRVPQWQPPFTQWRLGIEINKVGTFAEVLFLYLL